MTIRDIFIAFGYKIDEDSEKKAEASIQGLKDTATRLLGALGIGFSIAQVNQLSEEFRTVNDQIEQATKNMGDQREVQEKILESANATKTAYAETAKVVTNLVQENTDLFGTLDEAIEFNNACTMLFKTAGKTNDQIAGLMESINKSFAKGKVDSETIGQLLEQSPEAVALLNRRLGSTTDQLEDLAANGKISLKDLRDSFVDSADEIAAAFGKTSFKISDAFLYIRNKFGLWVAQMDESVGVSQGLGTALVSVFNKFMGLLQRVTNGIGWLADKLGGMNNLLKLILIVAGSIFAVLKFNQIISGLKAIGTWLTTLNLKTMAIIAVVVLLALLVEDFIKFMKGEDSLLGSFLESAGIDADDFREKIKTAFQSIRDFVLPIWEGFVEAFSAGMAVVSELWDEYGDDIMSGIGLFISTVGDAITSFLTWITGSEDAKEVLHALGEAIGVIVAALTIAIPLIAVIEGAIALLTSPVFLVIAAIIALITIIHLLIENWDAVVAAAQNCWEWIKETWAGVADWFNSNVVEPIAEFFGGLVEDAVTWGADIMSSIVDGINSGIQWVVDAVSGVAQDIKNFLGFSEPEEGPLSNFHTYMPDMIDLMTTGIRAGRTKVREAMSELAGDVSANASLNVLSSMQRATSVAPQTLRATQTSNTSRVVNQTNNFKNTFSGERDVQRTSSKAMTKASGKATAELARALAFVN